MFYLSLEARREPSTVKEDVRMTDQHICMYFKKPTFCTKIHFKTFTH